MRRSCLSHGAGGKIVSTGTTSAGPDGLCSPTWSVEKGPCLARKLCRLMARRCRQAKTRRGRYPVTRYTGANPACRRISTCRSIQLRPSPGRRLHALCCRPERRDWPPARMMAASMLWLRSSSASGSHAPRRHATPLACVSRSDFVGHAPVRAGTPCWRSQSPVHRW